VVLEEEMMKRWGKHIYVEKLKINSKCGNLEEKLRFVSYGLPNVCMIFVPMSF